ncbi:MAG: hypothetical protein Q8934_15470 [Bacillota bacterium]|nr:hypothetical protein [Bacillota bacterium]
MRPLGDVATFFALGFVVIGIGLKSNDSKRKYINKRILEFNVINSKLDEASYELNKSQEEMIRLKEKLNETEAKIVAIEERNIEINSGIES